MTETALGILFALAISSSGFAQEVLLHTTQGAASVDVLRVSSTGALVASVTWPSGYQTTVTLSKFVERFRAAHFWQDSKIVLIGGSVEDGSRIVVIDRNAGTVVDEFSARGPVVSPSGRFLSFARYLPNDEGTHVFLRYDLSLTPAQNRMRQSQGGDPGYDVGIAYFPSWHAQEHSYDAPPGLLLPAHLKSPIAWLDDIWVAFVTYDGVHLEAVVANTATGESRQTELAPADLVDPQKYFLGNDVNLAAVAQIDEIIPLEISATSCHVRLRLGGAAKVPTFDVTW